MLTYLQAVEMWEGMKRKRPEIKLAGNTTLRRLPGTEDFAIRYHQTDIVRLIAPSEGTEYRPVYQIDHGGYCTMSTKDRINEFSPVRMFAIRRECFVSGRYEAAGTYDWIPYAFERGMICDELGRRIDAPAQFVNPRTGKPIG